MQYNRLCSCTLLSSRSLLSSFGLEASGSSKATQNNSKLDTISRNVGLHIHVRVCCTHFNYTIYICASIYDTIYLHLYTCAYILTTYFYTYVLRLIYLHCIFTLIYLYTLKILEPIILRVVLYIQAVLPAEIRKRSTGIFNSLFGEYNFYGGFPL